MTSNKAQVDPTVEVFPLGDFTLASGEVLTDARLAYRTFGEKGSPLILYPTWYSGTITEGNEWLVSTSGHSRKALDPAKYFIIIVALFGNGESTSPSNHPDGIKLPRATFYDNVKAQHRLLTELFKYDMIELVTGWSMGAATSFQWATQYPDMVKRCAPFCGAARIAPHNWVMLQAVKGGITTDTTGYTNGDYMEVHKSQPMTGLKAVARVYAGWGFSQPFYRRNGFKTEFGIEGGLENIMKEFWEAYFTKKDANNLLYMLWTWEHADIGMQEPFTPKEAIVSSYQSETLHRDEKDDEAFAKALKSIKAKTFIMPSRTDLYFPPEDSEYEWQTMGNTAELRVIESDAGHWAGYDMEKDTRFLDEAIYELLQL